LIQIYMDENVDGPITRGLQRRGVDVLTAQEDGRDATDDILVLRCATELGRLLFTRDDDLLREAAGCQRRDELFSGVIYAHQLDVSIGECIANLELIAGAGDPDEYTNRVIYLPL